MSRLTGILAFSSAVLAVQAQETCERTKVAVLGAGVAGVEAAKSLSDNGVDDFLLVEYQDRIGGRMHDVPFGSGPHGHPYVVEAGANWVQGTVTGDGPENPIHTLVIHSRETDQDNTTYYDPTGPVDYSYAKREYEEALGRVTVDAGSLLQNNIQDRSFRAGLRLQGWDPAKDDSYRQTAEWWLFDGEFAYTPSESSQIYTSVAENATFNYFSEENLFVYDQRGFANIIRGEAAEFLAHDDRRLRLSTQVTGVDYNRDSVTVRTNRGCIHADYAIMTFSLGVLQKGVVDFVPQLPSWKKTAIHSFELGTYTKIFMQFPWRFWENAQYLIYADPETRGYYPEFQPLDLPGVLEGSGLMVATVVDDQSYRVESQSFEQTQAEVMEVLRSMYGPAIPDPTHLWYKRWGQTPWAYGSYSNWPPSTSLQGHQNLRANVGNLFFAGEATSQEFFGYLQGAYFEGKHVGTFISDCVRKTGNCTVTDEQQKYPVLTGVTPYNLYNEEHGWFVDTVS
ncbi:amine oxidase [Aspergillus candidus]|uniref:Amine oxidase n=1 Tax=Aspergillus candidus TaxID=41067 RepID=A0A2I2FGU9_ASPCN|nr:amine oxidase [Aspergillus candidus]PLB39853.1 amine oxidase [Aspergillus candidus]